MTTQQITSCGIVVGVLTLTGCGVMKDSPLWSTMTQAKYGYQPQTFQTAPQPTPANTVAQADVLTLLEGCVIVANDGQPLGVITQNQFATNSILNEFGKYGSKFSATSIFNQFGKYGGEFSQLSPFNQFTTTPPQIISPSGQFVGFLTKNLFKAPAIDPHALIGLLKSTK